jgi:TRAP-type mannitol/chloroaromatic compound transport system permease small subunit
VTAAGTALHRLAGGIERLNAVVGQAVAWLLLPLMAIIMIDVIGRRFMRVGSVTLQELEWQLHTTLFLFTAAYAYQLDAHVRIDILRERLSARARTWVEVVGCALFLIPYSALLTYLGFWFWKYSWDIGEVSDAPGGLAMRWVIKATVPLGFTLLFLQGWATLIRKVSALRGMP